MKVESMSENDFKKWEQERVGGKTQYVLRNSIVWSLVVTFLMLIVEFLYPFIFSRPNKPWFDIVGVSVLVFVALFISCWIWLTIKWGNNETQYQQMLKKNE